ncbi:MAG TPA: alanine--tRNA ligase [Methylomirabilota bacterium]|nr:alanine--tRNA ligase [Methylomirabilota bacterium]
MTSAQIRQSFLDFFKSKQHSIVPSSSLMPDSPNLLFTNAGMNQFVPIFLGQKKAESPRAANTQKCIRAGGKHNDLDDVGLDTYHHTFFEMLGNWSFGDYFKKEAIDWAWELVVKVWKFPPQRLYATVFCPYLGEPGWEKKWANELEQVLVLSMTSPTYIPPNANASPFEIADQEAAMFWAKKFTAAGCDPKVHIVPGNKKDNFWMMGETGPCGPCTEVHVDLTPDGNTRGSLVNKGDSRCIEIWNLVFIQFNANPDGTFAPLPAQHVDTGMGFERVTSIIQGTKNFSDFANAKISNYETDIFRPIFDELEKLSGKKYGSTLPVGQASSLSQTSGIKDGDRQDACPTPEQIALDIAFRVIADHIRTLSFAIADRIQPDIKGRNSVLRSIHKRMSRYASTIDVKDELLVQMQDALVETLATTMGDVFPDVRNQKEHIKNVLRREADVFNKTLARGVTRFNTAIYEEFLNEIARSRADTRYQFRFLNITSSGSSISNVQDFGSKLPEVVINILSPDWQLLKKLFPDWQFNIARVIPGSAAFELNDTYGFPLDLTELMARERGLTVDKDGFEKLMEEQRARARAAQKKEVISLSQIETTAPTKFVGFENLSIQAKVLEIVSLKDKTAVVLDASPFYAEMGGQVGDTGEISNEGKLWRISNTQKSGNTWLHFLGVEQASGLFASASRRSNAASGETAVPPIGSTVSLSVDVNRRRAIERHHTVTHLLHWALHEVVSKDATQKGSFVGPDKLTFDFNSQALTPQQISDIEKLVNEKILENAGVSWTEVLYADMKSRKDVMQFFGDKYGDIVRVVQIGGGAGELNGFSMELCGGTHTRATGEIGLFRIVGENAIAAGVRRIEAVAGLEAYKRANDELHLIKNLADKINSPVHELEKKIESLLAHQKELEKQLKASQQRQAAEIAKSLFEKWRGTAARDTQQSDRDGRAPHIIENLGAVDGDFLQAVADSLKGRFKGVMILGGATGGAVALVAAVSPEFVSKIQAGKIIQTIALIVGGKGGGKPDNARGGGKDAGKLDEALAKAKTLLN